MTNYDKLLEKIRALGMDYKWAKMFVKKFADDERAFPIDEQQKKWAMQKGFFPGRMVLYGLTDENYQNYLPDWNYFMLHPLNHHFKIWVNDKLSLKYVLNSNGCQDTMPKYYLYVENDGKYTYLMDAPSEINKDKDVLLEKSKSMKKKEYNEFLENYVNEKIESLGLTKFLSGEEESENIVKGEIGV